MEQIPSWEAETSSSIQEILHILWNLKVHSRTHKCPPPVHILNQIDPAHALNLTCWLSIWILSSQLRVGLQSGFHPWGLPTKTFKATHNYLNLTFCSCREISHKIRRKCFILLMHGSRLIKCGPPIVSKRFQKRYYHMKICLFELSDFFLFEDCEW